MFHSQLFYLGQRFKWSCTIQHHDITIITVVLHIITISLFRLLFWIQKTVISTSCPNKYDPQTNSTSAMVYEFIPLVSYGKYFLLVHP